MVDFVGSTPDRLGERGARERGELRPDGWGIAVSVSGGQAGTLKRIISELKTSPCAHGQFTAGKNNTSAKLKDPLGLCRINGAIGSIPRGSSPPPCAASARTSSEKSHSADTAHAGTRGPDRQSDRRLAIQTERERSPAAWNKIETAWRPTAVSLEALWG